MRPRRAISRKQIRHNLKRRYTLRGRPHCMQRVYARTLYFGLRCALMIKHFFAMTSSFQPLNGNPNASSKALPCSSFSAVVTIVALRPITCSTLSRSISGKIVCSRIPTV